MEMCSNGAHVNRFTGFSLCAFVSLRQGVSVCGACWLQPETSWLFHTRQADHRCHPAVLPVSTIIAFSYVTSQSQSRWLFLASVFYSEDKPSPHLQLICLPCLSICSHCSHYIHVCQVHSLPFALCLTAQLEHPWHTGTEAQGHHHFHILPYVTGLITTLTICHTDCCFVQLSLHKNLKRQRVC